MLSIRTQNRMALLPYDKPIVVEGRQIQWALSPATFYVLGTYPTKERALEVLDEIEEAHKSQTKVFINEDEVDIATTHYDLVYQMPKE